MPAYPITQAAVITSHPVAEGIRLMIREENPIMDFIQWDVVPEGNAQRRWFDETNLPTSAFRGVYGTYTPTYGTLRPRADTLSILGGEFDLDIAINRLYGNEVPDFVQRQLNMHARATARKLEETWFEGDAGVDANSFDGLRVRAAETSMNFPMGGSSSTDATELTLAKMDEVQDAVMGSAVWHMNQWLKRKVNALVRSAGQAREMVGTEFGRQFEAYAGTPIVIQQRANDMTTILGFDEDPGDGGDDAASMYLVHYGQPEEENAVLGIIGAGGAWNAYPLGEEFDSPQNKWRLEVYPGMSVNGNRAFARLSEVGQI